MPKNSNNIHHLHTFTSIAFTPTVSQLKKDVTTSHRSASHLKTRPSTDLVMQFLRLITNNPLVEFYDEERVEQIVDFATAPAR